MEDKAQKDSDMNVSSSSSLSPFLIHKVMNFSDDKFIYKKGSKMCKRFRSRLCKASSNEPMLPEEYFKLNLSNDAKNLQYWLVKVKRSSKILFRFKDKYFLDFSEDFNMLIVKEFLELIGQIYESNSKNVKLCLLISEKVLKMGILDLFEPQFSKFSTSICINDINRDFYSMYKFRYPLQVELDSSSYFDMPSFILESQTAAHIGSEIEREENELESRKLEVICLQLFQFESQFGIFETIDCQKLQYLHIKSQNLQEFKKFFNENPAYFSHLKTLSFNCSQVDLDLVKSLASLPCLSKLIISDPTRHCKFSVLVAVASEFSEKNCMQFNVGTLEVDVSLSAFDQFKLRVNGARPLFSLALVEILQTWRGQKEEEEKQMKVEVYSENCRKIVEVNCEEIVMGK